MALEGQISSLVAEGGFTVIATELPAGALAELTRAGLTLAPKADGMEVKAPHLEEANRAIDIVRQASGLVKSVNSSAQTLEDLFIRVTSGDRAA